MAFTGQLYRSADSQDHLEIISAIVTPERIVIDWTEGAKSGHLDATSSDGVAFSGEFGSPEVSSQRECELTLYKSPRELLLFGTWRDLDQAVDGVWVFRLQTSAVRPPEPKTVHDKANQVLQRLKEQTRAAAAASATDTVSAQTETTPVNEPAANAPAGSALLEPVKSSTDKSGTQFAASISQAVAKKVMSARLDHLMPMTSEEFAARGSDEIATELIAAPSSAVFKVAHNAAAPELRALAAAIFAQQYDTTKAPSASPVVATSPAVAAEPVVSATPAPVAPTASAPIVDATALKASKRRSSKHQTKK